MPTPNHHAETPKIWFKRMFMLCKRGNLESELLLIKYLNGLNERDKCYLLNAPQACALFESLLQENDQDLFCWLMKHNPKQPQQTVAIPAKYQDLIECIRAHYLD